ncbi:prolactin-inducible protein [Choloepus didactylus]|uniref:prolactin-inducible protein n=1 Tax=Choloepus didactylus TaxID=27675 RepID=UPI00189E3E9A|nr:prolactin-inducible protein [Choloepus didactylus]
MYSFQFLSRAGPATLLLVLCLQLGTSKAQEDNRKVMIMDLQVQKTAKANEEFPVTLKIQTQLRECMVIKTYLLSNTTLSGPSTFQQTLCLCDDNPRTIFWDFQSNYTTKIVAVADVVRESGICPNDKAVIPIQANRFYTIRTVTIVP